MPESDLDDLAAEAPERRPQEHATRRRIITMASGAAAAVVAIVAVVLMGSGLAPAPVSLRAETDGYHVRLDLDGTSLGQRTATIHVDGADGRPVAPADVDVHTSMQAMRMDGTNMRARQTAPGRYEAKGELFTMLGDWTVTVRISEPRSGSAQEVAFTVKAVP